MVAPSGSKEARISPGHRRRPGLRRHDTFVRRSVTERPLVTQATIAPRNKTKFTAGPGRSSGMTPAASRKCRMSVTHVRPNGRLSFIALVYPDVTATNVERSRSISHGATAALLSAVLCLL
jgi:hypothetical protein